MPNEAHLGQEFYLDTQSTMTGEPKKKQLPFFTMLGILGPLGVVGLGIVMGIAAPHPESDWFGASVFVSIGIALIIASFLAIVCSVIAFIRRERAAFLTTITVIPALLLLFSMLATWFRL